MIKELNNQELDNFVSTQKYSQFLQSSVWEKFQNNLGHRTWKIGILDPNLINNNPQLLASALVIEKKMPLGMTYLYCPRGPVIRENLNPELKENTLKIVLKGARDICIQTLKRKEVFFKFESRSSFNDLENIKKAKDLQPAHTLLLDLNKEEGELLAEMHSKTRYNIRLAKKKGIIIERVENYLDQVDIFKDLINQTARRDKFVPHSTEYYQEMLSSLGKNINLWVAKYQGQVLVANLVINFGDTVTYLHGASSNQHRNLMAPHLLQWEQIKWAKNNGFRFYDFWGIAKNDDINNKWSGFTRFKKGFGGFEKKYAGTFDLVYDQKIYKLYNFTQHLLKIIKSIK